MPQISLVSFRATQGDRHQQPVWPFRSLRCIVIDE
jgi:hypothetical protein